jgi:hypothetical protein
MVEFLNSGRKKIMFCKTDHQSAGGRGLLQEMMAVPEKKTTKNYFL